MTPFGSPLLPAEGGGVRHPLVLTGLALTEVGPICEYEVTSLSTKGLVRPGKTR